jgi:hypothetical protein
VEYGAALDAYYKNGAPADWQQSYISAYATMHPWEDWAETWAHYLLIVDVLDTSTSYGVALLPSDPSEPTLNDQTPVEDASFENLMKRWFPLTYALNSLNRSLGMPDGYPFTLAAPVIEKLRLVHRIIAASGGKAYEAKPEVVADTTVQRAMPDAQAGQAQPPTGAPEDAASDTAALASSAAQTPTVPLAQPEPVTQPAHEPATPPVIQPGAQPN